MRFLNSAALTAMAAVMMGCASSAYAQRRPPEPKPPKQQPHPPAHPQTQMHQANPNARPGQANAGGPRPVEEFMRMSPAERENALAKLPQERQEKVRQQLQRYDEMAPEQKQRLQRLWQLSPERQQAVRQSMREFGQQPQDRRQAMNRQLRQLQSMSPEERKAYFNSPEFKTQFNAEEQEMMKNLNAIAPEGKQ